MTLYAAMTERLVELASSAGWEWDDNSARYRDKSTGRFVSERTLLKLTERSINDILAPRVDSITARFLSGDIQLSDWQRLMAREIKDAHIIAATIGRGGREQMAFSDWGKLGSRLKFEYQHLNQFALDIAAGKLSDAQIQMRAAMYAEAPRSAYYDGLTSAKKAAGLDEERRVTNSEETCPDCIDYEAQGWQPIGALPEPGTRSQCGHNCKCEKEYRKSEKE